MSGSQLGFVMQLARSQMPVLGEKCIQNIEASLAERIRNFIDRLMELDGEQTIFDEMLWGGIMEHMTVYEKGKATFTFVGGIEVTVG